MAKEVITGASISVGGVDLSTLVKSVTVTQTGEAKETTAFGNAARARVGGLLDYELSIDWYGDYAASQVYATIQPLLNATTECIVKKDSGTTAATNPSFTGTFLVTEFPFIDAEHGEVHEFSTTWPYAGGTEVTPATT